MLREIDRARQEERDAMVGEVTKAKKSTGLWLGVGLALVLLLAGGGIGGAMWWNQRRAGAEKAALEGKLREQQAAMQKEKTLWSDIEKRVSPAVPEVHCFYRIRVPHPSAVAPTGEFGGPATGSGVVIKPGLILTAKHVVQPWTVAIADWSDWQKQGFATAECELLQVQFAGQQPVNATVVALAEDRDLALLQIHPTSAPVVPIATSNRQVNVTDRIAVVGYPAQLGERPMLLKNVSGFGEKWTEVKEITPTFVVGTVSQPLTGSSESAYVLFDASVTHGNSGGALVNEKGELIGIVSQQPLVSRWGNISASGSSSRSRWAPATRRSAPITSRPSFASAESSDGQDMSYRVIGRLAAGGFSEVFEVEDAASALAERLVLKRLNAEMSARPEVREAFSEEAKLLRELKHPNVVTFRRCYFDEQQRVCLLMEKVAGQPLDAWARRHALRPEAVFDLFERVLAAVDYLHHRATPFLHLDLKPDNVLVTTTPEGFQPVLIDFGIARRSGRQGLKAYTPPYGAPEQETGGTLDCASDVYALGQILVELLALVTVPDDIRHALAAVAAKATLRARRERFADAGQMRLAFRQARRRTETAASRMPKCGCRACRGGVGSPAEWLSSCWCSGPTRPSDDRSRAGCGGGIRSSSPAGK